MADPFSIIAGTVGIADVAVKVVKYLRDVQSAMETVDNEIEGLVKEVTSLKDVHEQLEAELRANINKVDLTKAEVDSWGKTQEALVGSTSLVTNLETELLQIYGDIRLSSRKRDVFSRQNRKREKDGVLSTYRAQIHTYQGVLHHWLSQVARQSNERDHDGHRKSFVGINATLEDLKKQLDHTLAAVKPPSGTTNNTTVYNMSYTVHQNAELHPHAQADQDSDTDFFNKHFYTPKVVDQYYTGRTSEAEQLRQWILPGAVAEPKQMVDKTQRQQKCFVVYGIGGSGKTQFCCKFAADYCDSFWGVFWVDGSNQERLKKTFAAISKVAEVDENHNAVIHWLSTRTKPWLLIIDNADDPNLDLTDFLPRGSRGHIFGHILITTRDPGNRWYGTVGVGFFEFKGLDEDDARCLLLTAAGQAEPWNSTMSLAATNIVKTFGYLALAITLAGKTIRLGFCKLLDYMEYHKQEWIRMRQQRPALKNTHEKDDLDLLSTFELSRKAIEARATEASRDALQLLDTFAFLHNQDIRFDILKRAVTNAEAEELYQAEQIEKEVQKKALRPPLDWPTWWHETTLAILGFIYKNRSPPVLPEIVRDGRRSHKFDAHRFSLALRELTRSSLITYNEKTDGYSMHSLVHKWARDRPSMSTTEQCVWSEAATVLLSHCVLLPPLGTTTKDEDLRKYLLPHVIEVRDFQQSIKRRMENKRMARMKPWPVFDGGFNRERTLVFAKFSLVFAQNGHWDEARELQMAVRDFALQMLGLQHATTRRITMALSNTLFHLGEQDDAAALQREVLNACIDHLGPDDHETLTARSLLGQTRYLQGRITDAKSLLEQAVTGLTKLHGVDHEDTLDAIDWLGKTVLKLYTDENVKQAERLHRQAVEGMRRVLSDTHLRTLTARENLCQVAFQTGDKDLLHEAHDTMSEILELRKEKLGKEHAYTLLAMVNLALMKSGLGDLQDADALIHKGLPIAERNLGRDHVACLWARYHIGRIWVKQERWREAEIHLLDCTERQRNLLQGRGQYHPDRLGALIELAKVYHALGSRDKCNEMVDEALVGFATITKTYEHPLAARLKADRQRWNDEMMDTVVMGP